MRRADGGEIDGPLRGEVNRALAAADRANNAVLQERDGRWTVQGDPTEAALIVAARKAGMEAEVLDARFERVGEVPFSSERKLMSTVHTDAKREEMLLAFTKGAPDVLLARCTHEQVGEERRPLTPERRDAIRAANEGLAKEALRTLGVALRLLPKDTFTHDAVDEDIEHDLVFLGLDRHDRSTARGGGGRRSARESGRDPAADDHGRSPRHSLGDRRRARHRGRRPRRSPAPRSRACPTTRSRRPWRRPPFTLA